jgi:hypothetical protein
MANIEVLKRRAMGLAGKPAPGDASGTARVLTDLCQHVSTLQHAVAELLQQMQYAQHEIAELKKSVPRKDGA